MPDKWAIFPDSDSFPGQDAAKQNTSDFEMCKRFAEVYNYTGFIHKRGEVFFRSVPVEHLMQAKVPSRGTTLFIRVPQGAGGVPIATATAIPQATAATMPQAGWQGQQQWGQAPGGRATPPKPWRAPDPWMAPGQMSPGQMGPGQMMPGQGWQQAPGQQGIPQQQQYSPRQQMQPGQPMQPGQQMMPGQPMMPGQQMPGTMQQAATMNHMLIPPTTFPSLNQAPEDQLGLMIENAQLVDDWIVTLPDVKAIEDRIQKTREERSELAEQILAKESEFTELKTEWEAKLGEVQTQLSALQALNEQRADILEKRSPEEMAELLMSLANDAEEIAEQAFNDACDAPGELDNGAVRELRAKYVADKTKKHANLALAEYLKAQAA